MALSNVREIKKAAPLKGLSRLIDQAGELNAQKNDYEAAYNRVREEIALQMPLGDKKKVWKMGDEYEAEHFLPSEHSIDPEKLWRYCKEHRIEFWGYVKVLMQNVKKTLPADDFHNLENVTISVAPRLTITKIKRKRAA